MAHRPIPTIHEFVLRAIQIGEGTADGIAHFLGLEVDLIEAVLRVLRTDALIAFAESEPEGGRRHVLTEFGSERLIEEHQYEPQEEMLVIDYDGIRRKPIWLGSESVVRASDLSTDCENEVASHRHFEPTASCFAIYGRNCHDWHTVKEPSVLLACFCRPNTLILRGGEKKLRLRLSKKETVAFCRQNQNARKWIRRGECAVETAAISSRHAREEVLPFPGGRGDARRSRRVLEDRSVVPKPWQQLSRQSKVSTDQGGKTHESTDYCGPAVPRLERARSRGYVRLC